MYSWVSPADRGGEVLDGVVDGHVGAGVADGLEVVEVAVGVAGLALGGFAEVARDLGVALDVGNLGEVEVAPVGLGLAGKGVLEVLMGLGAVEAHGLSPACSLWGTVSNLARLSGQGPTPARVDFERGYSALVDSMSVHPSLLSRLRDRGYRLTSQRRVVAEVLEGDNVHLTADEVHQRAMETLPEISRATVYSALHELAEMGEVLEVNLDGRSMRYDPNVEPPHHHLMCDSCGLVYDVLAEVDAPALSKRERQRHADHALGDRVPRHLRRLRGLTRSPVALGSVGLPGETVGPATPLVRGRASSPPGPAG